MKKEIYFPKVQYFFLSFLYSIGIFLNYIIGWNNILTEQVISPFSMPMGTHVEIYYSTRSGDENFQVGHYGLSTR